MNFVRRWIKNWIVDTINTEDSQTTAGKQAFARHSNDISIASDSEYENHRDTFRFNVQPARGGIIVTIRKYNQKIDDTVHIVHVIHDDQDVAQSISEIVSMELLRA